MENIYYDENGFIHIKWDGAEFKFKNLGEFLDELQGWQEFAIFTAMEVLTNTPDEAFQAMATACRN